MKANKIKAAAIIILLLLAILFLIRLLNPREMDDISPEIPCENEKEYIEKSEYLWVIPEFNNTKISENSEWCREILNLNKTLGMHGIKHTYREFKYENISQKEMEEGIEIFRKCFGFEPELFKPPNLYMSKESKALAEKNNLKIRYRINQLTNKVYHCNDSGTLPNWFHEIF